jgi:hypothetical protein
MTTNTSIPAFPVASELCQDLTVLEQRGMTLRDYFAAKAMQTIPKQSAYNMKNNESHEAYTARRAYEMADAMLKARG